MSLPDTFSVTLGTASEQYPRNTEGDVVVLRDGRLLACWSRFYGGGEDHSAAHIAARVSSDAGRTWGEPFILQENVGRQNVMSASFLRERDSGDLLFFYLRKDGDDDLTVWCRRSTDEAATWSDPVLVTPYAGYNIMNNGRVVQLSTGRLLAPVSWCRDIHAADWHLRDIMFFSDDGGRTWAMAPGVVDAGGRGAMEPGVVELRDGRVLQIIRTMLCSIHKSYSADGGLTWTPAEPLGVEAPEAPSTITRIPTTGDLVLFYNPLNAARNAHGQRCPLSVAVSSDEGTTWRHTFDLETDAAHTYAYLSCTFHDGGALLTYWVTGPSGFDQRFTSLPTAALHA
jgi:sialidase-1